MKRTILIHTLLIAGIVLASFIAINTTKSLDSNLSLFLNDIRTYFLYTIAFLLGLAVISFSIIFFRKTKIKIYLIPIFIAILTILYIPIIISKNKNLDKSPVLMVLSHKEDIAGNIYMEFKEDSTYKLEYYSWLDGFRYRGKYDVKNDTILLDKKNPILNDKNFMSNKLLIKNDSVFFQKDKNDNYDKSFYMLMTIIKKNNIFSIKSQ